LQQTLVAINSSRSDPKQGSTTSENANDALIQMQQKL